MIHLINFGSSKTPLIADVVRACGSECTIINWQNFSQEQIRNSSGMVFSGSPMMITEVEHQPYFEKFAFIKEGKIPVLGICFGHQLMGLLHGSKIFRDKEIRETIPIRVMKKDLLFENLF